MIFSFYSICLVILNYVQILGIVNCNCVYHAGSSAPKVPWLPKKTPFIESDVTSANPQQGSIESSSTARPVPALIPLGNEQAVSSNILDQRGLGIQDEMLQTQIRFNANAMTEIESLRADREQLLADKERAAKETMMLRSKYMRATEQLNYLKKKMIKESSSSSDEAISNGQSIEIDQTETNPANELTSQPQAVQANGEPKEMAQDEVEQAAKAPANGEPNEMAQEKLEQADDALSETFTEDAIEAFIEEVIDEDI